ncbi:MAG: hypothetical protein IJO42_00775 [Clostridia bacterium]|nr:hypothetical protein [Clostridia bacterium]
MGKTLQQYKDETYAAGKKSVDKVYKQKQETDAATLKQINAAIDKSTAVQTGQYQQRIDAAPLESRVEYDKNAIADAVSKQQIRESLANMGVTDSGLTSSMQTALAIQKQKADRTVRVNENAKIQAYQNAIDQIVAEDETKKTDAKLQRQQATADWYAAALADLENSSSQAAAEAYAADMDYAAKAYEADQKYNAQVIADQNAAIEKQNKAIQDAVQGYIDTGDDPETAKAKVNLQYPSEDAYTNLYYEGIRNGYSPAEAKLYAEEGETKVQAAAIKKAKTFVAGLSTNITGGITLRTAFGRPGFLDGKVLAEKITKQTSGNKEFDGMTATEKEAVLALAVANAVDKDTNWKSDSHEDNYERMKKACNILGVPYVLAQDQYDRDNLLGKYAAVNDQGVGQ